MGWDNVLTDICEGAIEKEIYDYVSGSYGLNQYSLDIASENGSISL